MYGYTRALSAYGQRFSLARQDLRLVAGLPESLDEQQGLTLTAPPATRQVRMQGFHAIATVYAPEYRES